MDNNTRLIPETSDVFVFNLKRFEEIKSKGGIRDNIIKKIETKINEGKTDAEKVNLDNLVELTEEGKKKKLKYKVATIDGSKMILGSLDKSGKFEDDVNGSVTGEEAQAKKDGYQYYNLFQAQRLKIETENNSTIKAILDSKRAKEDFLGQVVALEISSSRNAKSNDDTQINIIKGSKVIADRIDKGIGAVGTYINFGKIKVDKTSSILVEQKNDIENNVDNDNAVGAYGVNGTEILNEGNIKVGGKSSSGIYALSLREDKNGKKIVDEFGKSTKKRRKGQGTLKIKNSGTISMTNDASVGIYADNNNEKSLNTTNDVSNKKGKIEVLNKGVGIYGKNVHISNEDGNIKVGNEGIGIYSVDSIFNGTKLGKIEFHGSNGVGIYLKGKYEAGKTLKADSVLQVEAKGNNSKSNVGLFVDVDNTPDFETNLSINASENVISYYSKSSNIKVKNALVQAKSGGVGIAAVKGKNIEYEDNGMKKLQVFKQGTGIYGSGNTIKLNGNIEINGESGVGIYAKDNSKLEINKQITLNDGATNSVGVQAESGSVIDVNLNDSVKLKSSDSTTDNVGYYLNNASINHEKYDITMSNSYQNVSNIYVLAKNDSKVNFKNATIGGKGSIGFYLDDKNELKGTKIIAQNNGIGIYTKGNNINTINSMTIETTNNGIGIYSEKDIKLDKLNITSKDHSVGVYSNGEVVFEGDNSIILDDTSVGFYLNANGYLNMSNLKIVNATSDKQVVGVYYNQGTTRKDTTSTIKTENQSNVVATYFDNGAKANIGSEGKILLTGGRKNVAGYVTNKSNLNNLGTIELSNVDQGVGISVNGENSKGTNSNIIKVDKDSVGMIAINKSNIINETNGKISANDLAMFIDNSTGENKGEIRTENVGVKVDGNESIFTNSGQIISKKIGLYLNGTNENKIKLNENSKITLVDNNSVGIYAENAQVDFDIKPNGENENIENVVSLYATGTTKINSTITTANSKKSVGIYLKDSTVTFGDKAKAVVTKGSKGNYNTGIYLNEKYSGSLNVNVENKEDYTLGLRVTNGSTATYIGTIDTSGVDSVGALVEGTLNITDNNTEFKIGNDSIGVLTKQGIANIQQGKFTLNNGTAIQQDGGTLTLGNDVLVNGKGKFLILKNADAEISNKIELGEDSTVICADYDDDNDHTIKVNGDLSLGNRSLGIVAKAKSPNKVNITNSGKIEIKDNSNDVIGIYADNVNVTNDTKGIIRTNKGIYAKNMINVTNNGNIEAMGDNAFGIIGQNLSENSKLNIGKIEGKGNNTVGVYIKGSDKIELEKANINLTGNTSKGLAFENSEDFTLKDSNISISKDGTALASIKTGGKITNTNITLGENATGIYLEGQKSLDYQGTIKSSANTKAQNLVYVKDKGTINLDANDLEVRESGVGLFADNSTINTTKETKITVEKGIGVYLKGESADKKASISKNFKIIADKDSIGLYAVGHINEMPMDVDIKGENAKGYVLNNLESKFEIENINLQADNQIGIYSFGTGSRLKVTNLNIKGKKSYGIYNIVENQNIEVENINVEDSTIGNNSIGIYSGVKSDITLNKKLNVGKYSVGIYGINSVISQLDTNDINVAEFGVGIYGIDNSTININTNKVILGKGAILAKAQSSDVVVNNNLLVKGNDTDLSVGIYSTGDKDVTLKDNLTISKNLIGIYSNTGGKVSTSNGKTIKVQDNATGILTENAEVDNKSNVEIEANAKGIFVQNAKLNSEGNLKVNGDNSFGLVAKDSSSFNSKGDITINGNKSFGLYGLNSSIVSNGKIDIKGTNAVGVYSNKDITQNGDINVGEDAVGIFKNEDGNVNLTSTNINVKDRGYAVYYDGTSNTNTLNMNISNLNLSKEAVGVYANKVKDIKYKGNIKVGQTIINDNGYENFDNNKNSIGMYLQNSKLEYTGKMTVDSPLSVGIYAKKNVDVVIKSGSEFNVTNGAIGIISDDDNTKGKIIIEKGATFNVIGRAIDVDNKAKKINVSIGVGGYGGTIENNGHFNVSNGAWGIYYDEDTTFINHGTYTETNDGKAYKGIEKEANVGKNKFIVNLKGKLNIPHEPTKANFKNFGIIETDGAINLSHIELNLNNKMHIKADEYNGVAVVSPSFSKGNSIEEYVYKDIFRPKNKDGLGKFMGDIKSESISWIAKVGKTEHKNLDGKETETKDIIMTRVPYTVLIKEPHYNDFADGLEKVRLGIEKDKHSEIFKALDKINNYADFANSLANIRGDIYSNLQERILNINSDFDASYDEIINSNNVTRKVNKFSVIYSGQNHEDNTIGVSGYTRNSIGFVYANEKEKENLKYGLTLGGAYNKFKFNGATAQNSKEKVLTAKVGLYGQKTSDKFNIQSKVILGVNQHKIERIGNIIGDKGYTFNSKFYTIDVDFKTKLSYDWKINKNLTITPYVKADVFYSKMPNSIVEKGNTLALKVRAKDILLLTPKIGISARYNHDLGNQKVLSLIGDVEYKYNILPLYKEGNKAQFINSKNSKEYNLSTPLYKKNIFKVGAEIGISKIDKWEISIRGEYENGLNAQLRFNYKF